MSLKGQLKSHAVFRAHTKILRSNSYNKLSKYDECKISSRHKNAFFLVRCELGMTWELPNMAQCHAVFTGSICEINISFDDENYG